VAGFLSTPSLFTQSLFVYQFYRYWEGRVLLAHRQCPHRKRGSAFDGGRDGEEAEFTGVELVEAVQVRDDRDASGEQQGVGGVFGMRGGVSGGRGVADEFADASGTAADADVGVCGGCGSGVFRDCGICEDGGVLEVGCAAGGLQAVSAARE
jgi:hypothetical protein